MHSIDKARDIAKAYRIIYLLYIYYMTKIGKKEQLILNRIARKRIALVNENTTKEEKQEVLQLMEERKAITPWTKRKYETPEQMNAIILDYIEKQIEKKKTCTLWWLALALWMDVDTIRSYEKKDEFAGIIKYYRDTILVWMEEKLFEDPKAFKAIRYYVNNNFPKLYRDRMEIDNKHSWSISLVELSRLASTISEGDIIEGDIIEETLSQEV